MILIQLGSCFLFLKLKEFEIMKAASKNSRRIGFYRVVTPAGQVIDRFWAHVGDEQPVVLVFGNSDLWRVKINSFLSNFNNKIAFFLAKIEYSIMMQMIKMHFRSAIYSIMQKGNKLKYILKWFPKILENSAYRK